MNAGTLPIGINIDGVLEHDGLPDPSPAERFAWIAESGAFDFIEKNLVVGEAFEPYLELVERHVVPIGVLGGIFTAGRDEPRARDAIRLAGALRTRLFNCQLFARHADGHSIDDGEVAEFYLRLLEAGAASGMRPSLEVHVDMWNEDFGRVEQVAERLARTNTPLRITLDLAHLLYKIGNAEELALSGLTLAEAETRLRPESPQAFFRQWLAEGWVVHAHARAAVPNGPPNAWLRRGNDQPGRAIQYPMVEPPEGSFHSPWQPERLAPWRQAMQQVLAHIAEHPEGELQQVACEFIPFADCGGGARYSIRGNNLACAGWLREQWQALHAPA